VLLEGKTRPHDVTCAMVAALAGLVPDQGGARVGPWLWIKLSRCNCGLMCGVMQLPQTKGEQRA
jgi:hypothetical protein